MRHTFFALAALALAGCSISGGPDAGDPGIPAQGNGKVRTYAVSDFASIDLRGADDVDVRVGSGFSVRAEGDTDVLDRLRLSRDGQRLQIGRRADSGWHWGGGKARLLITMPRIVGARIAGSGDIAIDRAEGARFDGAVAGSGTLSLDAMQVDEARLLVAGSGDFKAKGEAKRIDVEVAGSGNVEAGGLKVGAAKVSVAGSGNVRADLDGEGEVRIAGSGDVDLGKHARCTTRSVGSGTVRCG